MILTIFRWYLHTLKKSNCLMKAAGWHKVQAGTFVKIDKMCRIYFSQKLINCAAQLFERLE